MDNGTADGAPDADGDGDGKPSCGGAPIDPAGPYAGGPWRNYFLILLDRIPTPIAVCQAHGEVLIANPAMAAQWGRSLDSCAAAICWTCSSPARRHSSTGSPRRCAWGVVRAIRSRCAGATRPTERNGKEN
ncbi:hypothetical protein HOK021_47470 [Streptomyces hygroscopicus]|nr:hypothetical protein HOK021_47470 [Streptomyces hygroscopicus]